MKRNFQFALYLLIAWVLLSPSLVSAKEHPALLLKSTTSKRYYIAKVNQLGAFKFMNVKPGTYRLSLIAPKEFFTVSAKTASLPIILQNMVWTTAGNKAMNVVNMTLPSITITSDMVANPTASGIKDREGAVILNPALTTADLANLSGTVANFPKEEY